MAPSMIRRIFGCLLAVITSGSVSLADPPPIEDPDLNWGVRFREMQGKGLDMRHRQLMLSEFVALRVHNLEKVYPQAQKLGRPLLKAEEPYELEAHSMSAPSVIYDKDAGVYRMYWYNVLWKPDRQEGDFQPTWIATIGYAESKDGLDWHKPQLGLYDYRGDGGKNNMLDERPLRHEKPLWNMLVVPGADGHERLRAFWTGHQGTALLKPDGVHWAEEPAYIKPHLFPFPNEEELESVYNFHWGIDGGRWYYDRAGKQYWMMVKTYTTLPGSRNPATLRRSIALARSEDGIRPDYTGQTLQVDLADDEYVRNLPNVENPKLPAWAELHDMAVVRYEGLLIGLWNIMYFPDGEWTGKNSEYWLAWSHHGRTWMRPPPEIRQPLIPMPWGTKYWGRMMIGASFLIRQGKELWIYHDVGNGHINRHYKTPEGKSKWITLSKLRVDGWAGYQARDKEGYLDTHYFQADGRLRINADSTGGELRVEVLEKTAEDAYRRPQFEAVKGFSKNDSLPVTGDVYNHEIKWKDRDWTDLQGKTVRLRIYLKNVTLYSFWTNPAADIDLEPPYDQNYLGGHFPVSLTPPMQSRPVGSESPSRRQHRRSPSLHSQLPHEGGGSSVAAP